MPRRAPRSMLDLEIERGAPVRLELRRADCNAHCPASPRSWSARRDLWHAFGPPQHAIRPDKFRPTCRTDAGWLAHRFARDHYKRVAPDPDHWPVIWQKVVDLTPEGFTREQLASMQHRVLIALATTTSFDWSMRSMPTRQSRTPSSPSPRRNAFPAL